MKNKSKIILSWIAVILWMTVIFMFSNMNADNSTDVSQGLIGKSVEVTSNFGNKIGIIKEKPSEDKIKQIVETFEKPVRKIAHFTEYLILGLLLVNALVVSGVPKNKALGFALLICFLYSITDEYHQLFINGRTGKVIDVLIDTTGSGAGILISKRVIKKKKVKKR